MKNYVRIEKSDSDARALKVELTKKAYQYFSENDASAARETNRLFSAFSTEEIDSLACTLKKLLYSFEMYRKEWTEK